MFSVCPGDFDWDAEQLVFEVETTPGTGWITLEGFLAFWT